MATGIRQKRVGRTTGTVKVRSAPTIQNVVVPRRGVVSYNPMEGATQVGAGIASRLEQMGNTASSFFNSLSSSAMDIAEIEHCPELPASLKANMELGIYRVVGTGSQILRDLGVGKMRLLSSPTRFNAISGFQLEVTEFVEND